MRRRSLGSCQLYGTLYDQGFEDPSIIQVNLKIIKSRSEQEMRADDPHANPTRRVRKFTSGDYSGAGAVEYAGIKTMRVSGRGARHFVRCR